jgi:spore coat protein CotF
MKKLFMDLLEHEIQHHGQLIRYIYGNKLTFPNGWKQRYNV